MSFSGLNTVNIKEEYKQKVKRIFENKYEEIQKLIDSSHDPKLIKQNEQPNANIIYHIYNDGEITQQKGGWAYLRRTEFSIKGPICKEIPTVNFPLGKGQYKYAITTLEDALKIRKLMME